MGQGDFQGALTELMVTFLLDMEAYKRTVRDLKTLFYSFVYLDLIHSFI